MQHPIDALPPTMSTAQKVIWVILMTGLTGVLYLAFRGYLAPEMLLDFTNTLLC